MNRRRSARFGVAWLELLCALAVLILIFQLFPSIGTATIWGLDVRNWPRSRWFEANGLVLLVLLAVRFGPGVRSSRRVRSERRGIDRTEKLKQRKVKEQREMLERVKEARKRRLN
jgi:hypothetical protein